MPHPTHAVAVRHPELGAYVALDPATDYDPNDPLVRAYPWAFARIEGTGKVIDSVKIEQATAEPGRKRNRS